VIPPDEAPSVGLARKSSLKTFMKPRKYWLSQIRNVKNPWLSYLTGDEMRIILSKPDSIKKDGFRDLAVTPHIFRNQN